MKLAWRPPVSAHRADRIIEYGLFPTAWEVVEPDLQSPDSGERR